MSERGDVDTPDYVSLANRHGVVKRGRRCTVCKIEMPPGTRYEETVGILDGEFDRSLSCAGMCTVKERLCATCGGDGGAFDGSDRWVTCATCGGYGVVAKE